MTYQILHYQCSSILPQADIEEAVSNISDMLAVLRSNPDYSNITVEHYPADHPHAGKISAITYTAHHSRHIIKIAEDSGK